MQLRAAILCLVCFSVKAEVVDRIAIVVSPQVITQSMLRRHIRLSAFFNNRQPVYSPETLKDAAEKLIDQALIRREIDLTKYTPVPMREVNERMAAFMERRKLSQPEFVKALAKYGFGEDDFKEELHWQLTLLRFIDFRFRPSIQVTEAEVRQYYEKTFVPQFQEANPGATPPALEQATERITAVVASEKSNTTLFRWLQQARQQARPKYYEEAFR